MKPKHEQPVIEACLRELPHGFIGDRKEIVAALPRARRFYLTEEASVKLGRIVAQTEDLILENHAFALPPFETTYIELNCRLLYEAAGKRTSDYPEPQDDWVGYLLDRGKIWTFSRNIAGKHGMAPFRFEDSLGHASMQWRSHICDEARQLGPHWGRLAVLLGSGMHRIENDETRDELLARFSMHPAFPFDEAYDRWNTYESSMGDLRNILAVLLLLNTPKHIKMVANQPRVGIVRGKRCAFAAHSVVHVELGERADVRRLFAHATGIKHRRHEVRGHFAHFHVREGCSHDWPTIPEGEQDGSPKWRCAACGGLRVWRRAHERGDAALGFVSKTYDVGAHQ